MKLRVNDKPVELEGSTLFDLMQEINIGEKAGIAVAVNESIAPKDSWNRFELHENDAVLIIRPTQGG